MLVTTLCFKKRILCCVIIKGAKLTLRVKTNQKSANLKKKKNDKKNTFICVKVCFLKNALDHII